MTPRPTVSDVASTREKVPTPRGMGVGYLMKFIHAVLDCPCLW